MSAVFLWLCKAGMILYVFTMLVLTNILIINN